jgi:hypothetical protein
MRHSWCTCLMLPLHLQGWKSGSVGVASERQMRQVSEAFVVDEVSERRGGGGCGGGTVGSSITSVALSGGGSGSVTRGAGSAMVVKTDGSWPLRRCCWLL